MLIFRQCLLSFCSSEEISISFLFFKNISFLHKEVQVVDFFLILTHSISLFSGLRYAENFVAFVVGMHLRFYQGTFKSLSLHLGAFMILSFHLTFSSLHVMCIEVSVFALHPLGSVNFTDPLLDVL